MQPAKEVQLWAPDESLNDKIDGELKGILRVRKFLETFGLSVTDSVITSRDGLVRDSKQLLEIRSMPQGFDKHQLPIFISNNVSTMFFITAGQPGATFPTHKHSKDTGLHIIVSGSIELNQTMLEVGDWFYVPCGCNYSFHVGNTGCTILHAYGPDK